MLRSCLFLLILVCSPNLLAAEIEPQTVEGQPLAANARRLIQAMQYLGNPLTDDVSSKLNAAIDKQDAHRIQAILDQHVLAELHLNPEYRVKVTRGPGSTQLTQHGYHPFLIKVLNDSTLTERLQVSSPQAGALYAGAAPNSMQRQQQESLIKNQNVSGATDRIFSLELFQSAPMTKQLSGLEVEYVILLVYCTEAGKREATLQFDVGQGTQDLGFRGEIPVLFHVQPAVPVKLSIIDHDGTPTTARLEIRDEWRRVCPPQPKRIAPDFFFQEQIYRHHGETIFLAPGQYTIISSRGPEYHRKLQSFAVSASSVSELKIRLERWINPLEYGFYSGDHHIHGAGCAHYQEPTLGVTPNDMFRQVKGEGLNVGCVLTWGPCFDFQRQFFSPKADIVSEPLTILKYDLEISGFGSAALGHVCLLNLNEQYYPGSEGTKVKGWPTWTVPVLRWAKDQGGVTGYPHSDMRVDPEGYATWLMSRHDHDGNELISSNESVEMLLPGPIEKIDRDEDGSFSAHELSLYAESAANELPNLVLPSMRGAGAMEIFVSTPAGVCDFISAMDTGRVGEWNTWYHLLNCGFPLKVSGETDFPCMSSRRVGQGRVYVHLPDNEQESLNFQDWCKALAAGRSYVSDGYAHALKFEINGMRPGEEDVRLSQPGQVHVDLLVGFAPEVPVAVAHGTLDTTISRREVGDTRILHAPRNEQWVSGGKRVVEVIVNGNVVKRFEAAPGELNEQSFDLDIDRSSWVALRQFPQLHTNPINVIVANQPIRASRESAIWCAQSTELLWQNRNHLIHPEERDAAKTAYDHAIEIFKQRATEAH